MSRVRRPLQAVCVLLAALATLLSTVAAPPPAAAAEFWETVGPLNLAQTQGMTYVSQADPRWGHQKMVSIPDRNYHDCACIISAVATLLNYEFPLPGDTLPHYTTHYLVPGFPTPEDHQELLWSPQYLDSLFLQRGLYDNIGACGTLPVPWAAAQAGNPKQILDRDGSVLASAPSGITLTGYDMATLNPKGEREPVPDAFNDVKDLVVSELMANRPVLMGRKTPAGGFHVYVMVGFDPASKHFLSYNVGWVPGRQPTEALMNSKGETYEQFEDSITDIWTYRRVGQVIPYLDWSSLDADGFLTSSGAPSESFELAMTTPAVRSRGRSPPAVRRAWSWRARTTRTVRRTR